MKSVSRSIFFALLLTAFSVAWCAAQGPAVEIDSTEAPAPDVEAFLDSYLTTLAEGDYPQALSFIDLRGLRQYLLERRLYELRLKNPEISDADLQQMAAGIQLNDLHPMRVQNIMMAMFSEQQFSGMTWTINGYTIIENLPDSYIANITKTLPNGQTKNISVAFKKIGDKWLIAPEIIEELGRKMLSRPVVTEIEPPKAVVALVDDFWNAWNRGEPDAAYELASADYKKQTPLFKFLEIVQALFAQIGQPQHWEITHCKTLAPQVLGLGITVHGLTDKTESILVVQLESNGWAFSLFQARPVGDSSAIPAAPIGGIQPLDMTPDLKPEFSTTPEEENPEVDTPQKNRRIGADHPERLKPDSGVIK